jgi:hypothetical protein
LGTGFGLRYDLSFFVIRFDLGFKTYNPNETGQNGFATTTLPAQHHCPYFCHQTKNQHKSNRRESPPATVQETFWRLAAKLNATSYYPIF